MKNGNPATWSKQEVFSALESQGMRRNDNPDSDYGRAKRYLFEMCPGGYIPELKDYNRLIGWICEYVGL